MKKLTLFLAFVCIFMAAFSQPNTATNNNQQDKPPAEKSKYSNEILATKSSIYKFEGRFKSSAGNMYNTKGQMVEVLVSIGCPFKFSEDGYPMYEKNDIYFSKNNVRRAWNGNTKANDYFFHAWFLCRQFYSGQAECILQQFGEREALHTLKKQAYLVTKQNVSMAKDFQNCTNNFSDTEPSDFNSNAPYIQDRNSVEVNFLITDTVIVIKRVKKSYQYAAKVNVEINVQNIQDSLALYHFNKYIPSSFFINDFTTFDYRKDGSIGLLYVIEDNNNHIKQPSLELLLYANQEDEEKNWNSRMFVSSKQEIQHIQLSEKEKNDYDLAKYEMNNGKQNLILYPLIGEYHYNLPKGEYFLYLVYAYNKLNDTKVFNGSFVSNKVKLIVE